MVNKLNKTFLNFIEVAQSMLKKRSETSMSRGLQLLTNEAVELRAMVDELENKAEFHQLVEETFSFFPGDYHKKGENKKESAWRATVKNFFRRTGIYNDFFEKKAISINIAFDKYLKAFQRREIQISYFIPIEFVYFAESSMDFGTLKNFGKFQINRFWADELETIFQNRINEIFYPQAVFNTKKLEGYWYLCLTEIIPIPKLGLIPIDLTQTDKANITYSPYPRVVESALQMLALYDWQADQWKEPFTHKHEQQEDLETGWFGFEVPFIIKIDDNLLYSPGWAPDISILVTDSFTDSRTGKEVEKPYTLINLSKDETKLFKEFIQNTVNLYNKLKIEENNWQFVEIALRFFIKAYFTGDIEQLLWHVTALEALIGEKGQGITKRLSQRIASILGKDDKERETLKKQFKELYSFRCDLVHGNYSQKQTYIGHLRIARNLARQIIIWFMHFLVNIQENNPNQIFKREEILKLIDLDKNSRGRLSLLLGSLPKEFPCVREWIK